MLHEGDLLQIVDNDSEVWNVGHVTHVEVENNTVTVFWMRSGMTFEYSNNRLEGHPNVTVIPKQD